MVPGSKNFWHIYAEPLHEFLRTARMLARSLKMLTRAKQAPSFSGHAYRGRGEVKKVKEWSREKENPSQQGEVAMPAKVATPWSAHNREQENQGAI